MATDTVTHGDDRSVLSPDPIADLSPAPSLGPGSSMPLASWSRRVAAESFGTFALVFVAVGADAMASLTGGEIGTAARAIAPALMVAALIYAIGDGSGAHFNPAVSLAFALKRLFPLPWLLPYWGAQVLGALAASLLVAAMFGDHLASGVSTPHAVSAPVAVVIEATLTTLLLVVILGTADRYRVVGHEAALAVGATIALCGLIALPVEGASMNPARSLGPAIVSGRLGEVWIYVVGPVLGAAIGVIVTRFLHGATEADPKAVEAATGDPARGSTTMSMQATGELALAGSALGSGPIARGPAPRAEPPRSRSVPPSPV